MVCKENVVSWFGNLSSYKRIDVMCTLLNMCVPFEVRYLGTCIEDIGKRDYNDLRDVEHHANSASELAELTSSVTDKRTRRKLALYMALLHSCNYACAVILYKNLSNFDHQEITNLLNGTTFSVDDQPLEELLLLYTMALNHPAFTYEQKSVFGNIFIKLQEEEARLNLSKINSSFKPTQGCTPCMSTSERLMEPEISGSCLMPPPPIQSYHGEMGMRNNAIVTGVPPGLTIPPPGLCLPGPEQMPMGSGGTTQYVQLGFPSINHMPPWPSQVMMGNQLMYHTSDVLAYPASPLVSRQSSPSQSRSPSRSNSPMGRSRTSVNSRASSSQSTQSTSTSLTSSSVSNSQTSSSVSNATSNSNNSLPPLPAPGASRSLPSQSPLLPSSRSVLLSNTSSSGFSRHNIDNPSSTLISATQSKQPPPPPRLRSSNSGDSLRETLSKEMPNFKSNLQNFSRDEIRRMSDEDLRDIGLTPNAVGQLRSIVKSQTSNGLNQISADKKLDSVSSTSHLLAESMENEASGVEVLGDSNSNTSGKSMSLQEQHPAMHHYHNHMITPNVRRYPGMPSIDPAQIQMYPAPPMYTAQNSPCYACLTVPVAGMQNRYSRCNAQHVYCLGQLQALRLDSESSRHCSQSSSSDSTGSRSPPETPPAAPWVSSNSGVDNNVAPPATDHMTSAPVHSTATAPPHVVSAPQQSSMQSSVPPESRQLTRKNSQTRTIRQKSQGILNGAGNGNGGPPSLSHCVSFPAPPTHSQLTYLPHGHFPTTLRPSSGIYSNFLHGPSARPAYQPAYQPNGEIMYPFTGHPASGSTPPPPPPPNAAAAAPVQASYMPPTPVVTYAAAVIPQTKISCYNCGSNSHLAIDCKDQTMEDITKKAQYRLDYTIMKQPGECPSSDK
ncbi:flocculation protein FLO11 isoform X2 [Mycetomoellerius zeteki]|nr:PREDICTED: flocculation protein FLO11 isoform X2 [Trachymyrmex zeteki]